MTQPRKKASVTKPAQPEDIEWPTPTSNARHRVRELRQQRKLSARELADVVREHGLEWDRDIVANFETGRRQSLSVDELVVLAFVLDVSPVDLLPRHDSGLQIGKLTVSGVHAAEWARGERPLLSQDADAWQEGRSPVHSGVGPLASASAIIRALREAGLEVRESDDGKR